MKFNCFLIVKEEFLRKEREEKRRKETKERVKRRAAMEVWRMEVMRVMQENGRTRGKKMFVFAKIWEMYVMTEWEMLVDKETGAQKVAPKVAPKVSPPRGVTWRDVTWRDVAPKV